MRPGVRYCDAYLYSWLVGLFVFTVLPESYHLSGLILQFYVAYTWKLNLTLLSLAGCQGQAQGHLQARGVLREGVPREGEGGDPLEA